jgi:5'-nucleotidase (lipoprotein e(P4) family)
MKYQKLYSPFLFMFTVVLATSCSKPKAVVSNSQQAVASTPDSRKDINAILWHTSAEYEALCLQAYNMASKKISAIRDGFDDGVYINNNNDKPAAVIMDIDETVLSNVGYYIALVNKNENYSEQSWRNWVYSMEAKPVPGAMEFIRLCHESDIKILFFSNRQDEYKMPTMENLSKFGFDVGENMLYFTGENASKAESRAKIFSNYKVIMIIGDNLADFSDIYGEPESDLQIRSNYLNELKDQFGTQYILLPNTLDGDWMEAIEETEERSGKNIFNYLLTNPQSQTD